MGYMVCARVEVPGFIQCIKFHLSMAGRSIADKACTFPHGHT